MAKAIRVKVTHTVTVDAETLKHYPHLFPEVKVSSLMDVESVLELAVSPKYGELREGLKEIALTGYEGNLESLEGEVGITYEIQQDDGWWVKQ